MNIKKNKEFKKDVLEVVHSQEPTSSRIFATYNTNKEMMEFMIVSPS